MPVIVGSERAQGLPVCAPGGCRVAECVEGTTKSERSQCEAGVGAQRAPERNGRRRWLARFQQDEAPNEMRVGIKRGVREQRRHVAQGGVAVTVVCCVQRGRQPLLARQPRLPA